MRAAATRVVMVKAVRVLVVGVVAVVVVARSDARLHGCTAPFGRRPIGDGDGEGGGGEGGRRR